MSDSYIFCGRVAPSSLALNENELRARLCCEKSDIPSFSSCLDSVMKIIEPRFVFKKADITLYPDGVDVGFGVMRSKNLLKNLDGCESAMLFAVTLGVECDRLILKRSKLSPADGFVCDAIASALAESLCDRAEDTIFEGAPRRPRFSIGYGDLSLEYQRPFLDLLKAERSIGITLSEGGLMLPTKSVTAIAGVL